MKGAAYCCAHIVISLQEKHFIFKSSGLLWTDKNRDPHPEACSELTILFMGVGAHKTQGSSVLT